MKSITKIEKVMTVVVLGLATGVFACCVAKDASALSVGDGLILNPVYEAYLDDVAMGRSWNIVPRKYVQTQMTSQHALVGDNIITTLPSAYSLIDSGYDTMIKNQGADGTCWAYALTTTMESTMRRSKGVVVDLSPKQLDYLTSTGMPYSDYLVGKFGDNATHVVGDGYGGFEYASFAITSEYAPVKTPDFFEKLKNNDTLFDSYDSFGSYQNEVRRYMTFGRPFGVGVEAYSKSMEANDVMGIKPQYLISEYTDLSTDVNDIDVVKEKIYTNGAVYVQTMAPGTENCWDDTTNTIVDKGIKICDVTDSEGNVVLHALALVGWDDNYEYTDPISGEKKTGAFIGQNSWGTSELFAGMTIDYDALMDYMVSAGMINESQITEENKQKLQKEIEDYNAYEYVHLAYDYESSYSNGGIIRLVSIDGIVENDFENVYDVIDTVDGEGGVFGDELNEEVFTFVANSVEDEEISGIAIGNHAGASRSDATYEIFVDLTGTGNNYVKYNDVAMPGGVYGQKMVVSDTNPAIDGNFKVKIVAYSADGSPLPFRADTTSGEAIDLVNYFTANVYTHKSSESTGPDEPGEDPDPEPGPGPDVPGTGLFTKEFGGAFGVASVLVVAMGAVFVMGKVYANRKSVFHRVKFGKK